MRPSLPFKLQLLGPALQGSPRSSGQQRTEVVQQELCSHSFNSRQMQNSFPPPPNGWLESADPGCRAQTTCCSGIWIICWATSWSHQSTGSPQAAEHPISSDGTYMGVLLCMCIMVCIYAHISDPCTHTQARCAHTAHRKLLLWTALLEVGIHTCQLHRSCCSWGTTQESSMLGNCSHILKDKHPKILLKPSVEVTRCSLWNSPFSFANPAFKTEVSVCSLYSASFHFKQASSCNTDSFCVGYEGLGHAQHSLCTALSTTATQNPPISAAPSCAATYTQPPRPQPAEPVASCLPGKALIWD